MLLAIALGCVFTHATAQAQQPGDANELADQAEYPWYQVELIVFRQLDAGSDIELFPPQPALDYPAMLARFTKSREERSALREAELAATIAPPVLLAAPEEELDEDILPEAFELLDAELRLHRGTARSLRLSRGYRVLFHQAWRQPVPERASPQRILITGGERFGGHFELEGYIGLSRSRYLHLDTQLWLNRFVSADGWDGDTVVLPEIPEPPLIPENTTTGTDISPTDQSDKAVVVTLGTDGVPSFSDPSLVPDRSIFGDVDLDSDTVDDEFTAVASWLLSQHRRLRSGELHYVDHPRFGALLYAEPWEPPEPEA